MNPDFKNMNRPGRPKGSPNKATYAARSAIADFVDGNVHRLEEWLNAVALGQTVDGKKVGNGDPNPQKAFELFQSVVEYHIPKLARTEIAGDQNNPVKYSFEGDSLNTEILKNLPEEKLHELAARIRAH